MKHLRYLFLLLGVVLFVGLAHKIGWTEIAHHLSRLKWWFLPILLLGAVWNVVYTIAWRRILHRRGRRIGIWALFRIKVAGETINTLTPVNFLGGDPVRIYLLRRYYLWTEGAASVVVDRTLHSMAILILILVGATTAFWRIPDIPLNIRYGLPVVLTIASAFVGFLFAHQRRGLFGFLMHAARRLRIRKEFTRATIQRFEELDGLITDFYRRDRKGFWIALTYHVFGRLLGIVEIFMVGALVNPRFGPAEAIILAGLAPIINFIFTFIPGAMGVLEGAYTAALYLLSLPSPIGVAIQVVRRIRAAIWIGIGFAIIGTRERHKILGDTGYLVSSAANNRV